jgi:1-aminocyclopropane-1-carboxylate deaminase
MANVSLLRLDQIGGCAPGNKFLKLARYIDTAREQGIKRLVSFGGPWSNHLHALAATGYQHQFETVGIVRGEALVVESAMLKDARRWGMRLEYVDRQQYRMRNYGVYLREIADRFAPCLVIPEGGAGVMGAQGVLSLGALIAHAAPTARRVVVPVGTGTTLAGIVSSLDKTFEVVGISALKGAIDLQERVAAMLAELNGEQRLGRRVGAVDEDVDGGFRGGLYGGFDDGLDDGVESTGGQEPARWRILHDYHCGGFARADRQLRAFMVDFETVHGIPIEPVYTGKMLFAIHHLLQCGDWESTVPVVAIHTGGLQGRRGFDWLDR